MLKPSLFYFLFFIFVFLGPALQTSYAQDQIGLKDKLMPDEPVAGQNFGEYISLEGNRVLISDASNVYLFEFDGNAWLQKQTLFAENHDIKSVDLEGDFAVISDANDIYFFSYNGVEWVEDDAQRIHSDQEIRSLAFTGNTIIFSVVRIGLDSDIIILKFNGTEWVEELRTDDNGIINPRIDIYQDKAVITIDHEEPDGDLVPDGVALLQQNALTGIWESTQFIPVSDGVYPEFFGFSVALYENSLIIGAPNPLLNTQGAAYLYNFNETSWVQTKRILPDDTESVLFGTAVGIDDRAIYITAAGTGFNGAAYIFEFDGLDWVQKNKVQGTAPSFARRYSLNANRALIASPEYEENDIVSGACFFYEFMAQPRNVHAADGESASQVRISWDNLSTNADGFKIYRDGIEIGSTVLAAASYSDIDALPGKIYKYEVTSYNNTWGESFPSIADYGWKRANGSITGAVQSQLGAGIDSVRIFASPADSTLGLSLEFDGPSDFVVLPFTEPQNTLSIAAWIKTTSANNQQIIGWSNTTNEGSFEFKTMNGRVAFKTQSPGQPTFEISGSTPLNNGVWQHVAVVINGTSVQLYVNGQPDRSPLSYSTNADVNLFTIGTYERASDDGLQTFEGQLDEIQLWETALTREEIGNYVYKSPKGNEPGLRSYWSFNDSSRSTAGIAADNARLNALNGKILNARWSGQSPPVFQDITNSNGEYSISGLFYDEGRSFRVTPQKVEHAFDPADRNIFLESSSAPFVSFIDTTVFTLSGQVLFAGGSCPVQGVELLIDNIPSGVFSDASGNFQLSVDDAGRIYTITPQYRDSLAEHPHSFNPPRLSFFVEGDIDNIVFEDTQRHLLYGKVRGGCVAGLGVADLHVRSLNNPLCLDTTISTDYNGNWRIFFPAQEYIVDLVAIDNPDSTNILDYFDPDTLDISWKNQSTLFIYHPEPIVRVDIIPGELSCEPDVPVLAQNNIYSMIIYVQEVYGSDTCLVDTGSVTLYDDIGGNLDETIRIDLVNGRAVYNFIAGEPNILGGGEHPYQKLLQIVAKANGYTVNKDQWALVTGARARTQTFFSTATPELPLMILRDPPGDQSYSFLSRDNTYMTKFQLAIEQSSTPEPNFPPDFETIPELFQWTYFERYNDLNITSDSYGSVFSYGGSVGFSFIIDVSADISSEDGGYTVTSSNYLSTTGTETEFGSVISLTMSEEFKTSDDPQITGETGDVFIGASLNQTFYLADIINYDPVLCGVVRDTSLVVDYTGFNSSYIYTEGHIRNVLIPQLEQLLTLADPEDVHRYTTAISVWQQVLEQNKEAKETAQKERQIANLPNPQFLLEENISFSGGTSTTQTTSMEAEIFNTVNYKVLFEKEFYYGFTDINAGVPEEKGFQWKWQSAIITTKEQERTSINKVGYTLADDDDGDYFSVDVLHDPAYGTPVFNLVAGTSSCPWEPGTQPRDGASLAISQFVQNNVSPDGPATFQLALGNISETGETRPYDLLLVQLSNPDGAIVKVGGAVMDDALSYYIPAGDSSYMATLTVERGPRAYDYDNLQLILVPPCEYDLYRGITTPLADTVNFSVHFASPLSNAVLSYPQDDWQVSSGEGDSLAVVISDYNINNEYLKSIKLQYRSPQGSWITAFNVPKEQLSTQSLRNSWSIQDLPDGDYELRAVSDGGSNGLRYSAVVKGRVERQALIVKGAPQPADHILNRGEKIAIDFTTAIDLDKLNVQRDVYLMDAADSSRVPFHVAVLGTKLLITPDSSFSSLGERTLIATIANISDKQGKRLPKALSWTFQVSQQAVYWKSFADEIRLYKDVETRHTAVLYNGGTEALDYRIEQLPPWLALNDEEHHGTLAAGAERVLTFAPNSTMPVGMISDSLSVMLDGQKETRLLSLNTLAAPPAWSLTDVNGAAQSAEVYMQLLLNEKLSDDPFDIVGVFINERLSGVGHMRYDEQSAKHMAAFSVYNQEGTYDLLDFRLWDASEGKEYRFISNEFVFQSGASYGSRHEPLLIQPNEQFQPIVLDKGLNWISFNVAGPDMSLDKLLENSSARDGDIIKSPYGFSQYSEAMGWTGTLDFLKAEEGYRYITREQGELLAAGSPANLWTSPVALKMGWNWVGYLPDAALELQDALQFMQAVPGDKIKSRNQSAVFNNNGEWLGTLKEMQPGHSYLIHSQTNTELVYPELKKQLTAAETLAGQIDVQRFESSMTLTAVFSFDGADYGDTSYVVTAWSADELRAVGQPQYAAGLDRFMTFLTIYGNPEENGDNITLQINQPSTDLKRDIAEYVSFDAEAHFGDLTQPLQLNALQTESERIPLDFYLQQNYPNPFNPQTTIEYGLPKEALVKVTIYDVLGQVVTELVNKKQSAGRYKIQFNSNSLGLASGVYFYEIRSKFFVKSYKMLLLK